MTKPAEKHPEMEKALDDLAKTAFGKNRTEAIRADICLTCDDPNMEFRDELSRKEYTISGMCQTCQDQVFGSE